MPSLFDKYEGSAAALSVGAHVAIAILVLWRGAVLSENRAASQRQVRPSMSWVVISDTRTQETSRARERHSRVARSPRVAALPISLPSPQLASLPASLPRPQLSAVGIPDGVNGGSSRGSSCGGSREVVEAAAELPISAAEASVDDEGEHFVQFWIRADGRVKWIAVSPPIEDSRYRRRLMEALNTLVFGRVKTPDGRPIDYVYSCVVRG